MIEILKYYFNKKNFGRFLKNISKTFRRVLSRYKPVQIGEIITLDGYKNCWVGYYDKSPFNPKDKNLLLIHANNEVAYLPPKKNSKSDILIYDIEKKKKILIGTTTAWNWQQGARALWISESEVIYNVYNELSDSYHSVIKNIHTKKIIDIPYAVQDINNNTLVSIDYKRLKNIRPDYGYFSHEKGFNNKTSLFVVYDLKKRKVIYEFGEDQAINQIVTSELLDHNSLDKIKVNHMMISPDGRKIIYLLRYFINSTRVTDLYVFNLNNMSHDLLLKNANVSHCIWKDNHSIILTCKNKYFGLNKLDINSKNIEPVMKISDGHPYSFGHDKILFDTYRNKYSIRDLYVIKLTNDLKDKRKIFSIVEPAVFHGVSRVDLHPSIDSSNTLIQVDVAEKSSRKVCLIKYENEYKT